MCDDDTTTAQDLVQRCRVFALLSLALGKFRRFIVHFRAFLRRAIIYKKSLSLYGLTSLSYLRNMSNVWYYSTFNMFVIVGSGLQLMFHQTDEDDKN